MEMPKLDNWKENCKQIWNVSATGKRIYKK